MVAEILNISQFPWVLTGEAWKVRVSQDQRQKCLSNYMNGAFNKTPINVGNAASSGIGVTEILNCLELQILHK